jgi:heterotetrameric sarcosine oxidase gamma subunit
MSIRRTCVSAPERLSPFGPEAKPGRHGAVGDTPVILAERKVDIVQVMAGRGADAAAAGIVKDATGLSLPSPRRAEITGDSMAVWIQPSGWLVIRSRGIEGALAKRLGDATGDTIAVVDQSHGRAVLRLSGAHAGDVLAKGSRVDLHPRVFSAGSAATTTIDHITVTIVQVDAVPTYDLVLPANFAEAFLDWLKMSAAEFGCEVRQPS